MRAREIAWLRRRSEQHYRVLLLAKEKGVDYIAEHWDEVKEALDFILSDESETSTK